MTSDLPRTDGRSSPAEYDDDVLNDVVERAFPDTAVSDLSPLPGESANPAFAVTTESRERFFLKYTRGDQGIDPLRRELSVTNYVGRETDIPVVEPLAYSFDTSTRASFIVTSWADGRPLEETLGSLPPHHHPQVFSNVGEILATLHEGTSFRQPGEIVNPVPMSFDVEPAGSWPELFARRLADRVEALQETRFEEIAEEVWSYVVDRLPDLETGEDPVLLHGDVGDGNVLYDGVTVSRVLDWERAFVGHPEYDLCRAEARYFLSDWGRPSRLQALFYDGYRSVRDLPPEFDTRRRCYLATFFLLPLSKYPEWGPAMTDDLDWFAEQLSKNIRSVMQDP